MSARRTPWTGKQLAVVKANWKLPDAAIKPLVDAVGPPRTAAAIQEARRKLGLLKDSGGIPVGERSYEPEAPRRPQISGCDKHLIALARALAEQEAA